jgi:hypothetical protein
MLSCLVQDKVMILLFVEKNIISLMIDDIFSGIIINTVIINAADITYDLILNNSTCVIPFMFDLKIEL